jgi:hypothetical protein
LWFCVFCWGSPKAKINYENELIKTNKQVKVCSPKNHGKIAPPCFVHRAASGPGRGAPYQPRQGTFRPARFWGSAAEYLEYPEYPEYLFYFDLTEGSQGNTEAGWRQWRQARFGHARGERRRPQFTAQNSLRPFENGLRSVARPGPSCIALWTNWPSALSVLSPPSMMMDGTASCRPAFSSGRWMAKFARGPRPS